MAVVAVACFPIRVVAAQELQFTRDLTIDAERQDLSEVLFVDVFNDGTIVVAQPSDSRVLFFSAKGEPAAAFGRAGAGPREFRQLAWVHGFKSDSLWLWDHLLRRLTLVDSKAGLLRSTPAAPSLIGEGGRAASGLSQVAPYGMQPDGSLVVSGSLFRTHRNMPGDWATPDGESRIVFFRLEAGGILGPLIDSEPTDAVICGPDRAKRTQCPRHRRAVSRDGSRYVRVVPTLGASGGGMIEVITVEVQSGERRATHLPFQPVAIPRRVVDSTRAALVEALAGTAVESYWRTAEFPKYYAPLTDLLIGRDRTIWIAFYPTERGRPWLILNPDGSEYGRMMVPENIKIDAGDKTTFWGQERREDGLENVVRFRFTRPG